MRQRSPAILIESKVAKLVFGLAIGGVDVIVRVGADVVEVVEDAIIEDVALLDVLLIGFGSWPPLVKLIASVTAARLLVTH